MVGKYKKTAKKLLGWSPKTSLESGLRNFIEWYKEKESKLSKI
ncbi:unnamed protein product [marine sediment metagenome]|uniref:NAD(P)-binding domain-containing protein n=1 Tax=marine sediment metagenome TaxID=412755 RepID=X1HQK8_9ZZZZ